ncbi:MAG: hypothetical protein HZA74_03370 [Ignavibacteriales bacterium]|jgi:hypothetical protein|nr:hypothetical protein [Ignavibacteriales bacterium]
MSKLQFKNYTYTFDKNEKKILLNFCDTLLKQMSADEKFFQDVRAFTSIVEKLRSNEYEIKFTKEERTKLVFRLKENLENMKKQATKGFFIRRWFYKSAYTQFKNIFEKHFSD